MPEPVTPSAEERETVRVLLEALDRKGLAIYSAGTRSAVSQALAEARSTTDRAILRELTELRRLEVIVRSQLAVLDAIHDPCGMRHMPRMPEETDKERFDRLGATRIKGCLVPRWEPPAGE